MTRHVQADAPAPDPTGWLENEMEKLRQRPCVLCVRLSAIGDVVMLGRSLQALQESGQTVLLVTSKHLLPVVSLFPSVQWAVTLCSAEGHGNTGAPGTRRTAERNDTHVLQVWHWSTARASWQLVPLSAVISVLAERGFEALIDFQRTARSRKACKALREAGIHWTRSYSVPKKTLYRASLVLWSRLFGSPRHAQTRSPAELRSKSAAEGVVARQIATIGGLKTASTREGARWQTPEGLIDFPQSSSEAPPMPPDEYSDQRYDVLLFSGASLPLKRWPLENCLSFAREILKRGHSLAFLGGPDEREFGDQLALLVPRVVNLAGKCSLTETFAHIRASRFVVTTDSFPAHVCDLMHKRGFVLFGSTSPDFGFAPLSAKVDTLYSGYSCSPCTRHGRGRCRFGQTPCMRAHRGEDVADRVDQILRSGG